MNAKGNGSIPCELCYWITFLTRILPRRSQSTFVELLIGAMLSPAGFVTDAYLVVNMVNHWTSYYKWLQKGKWSWLNLARRFVQLVLTVVNDDVFHIAIDDTLTLRASKKAPGSQIHHQHGNKPNLSTYVRGQCWVALALVSRNRQLQSLAFPLLARLIPSASNTGKLVAGKTLIRAIAPLIKGKNVRVLADSWYMRRIFIDDMLKHNFHVIGQVRIDTRLYDEPVKRENPGRGRPPKYGKQYTAKRIAHLKRTMVTLTIHGEPKKVRYRSRIVKARFLGGRLVRVVWSEFYDDKNASWRSARLLMSTDTTMTPEMIMESYGLRWSIETMFHQVKQAWGLKEAWQQTRQTLHRWVHLNMIGYGLVQMLSLLESDQIRELCNHSPWRKVDTRTAGHIRKGLTVVFRQVNVRSLWDKRCQKFGGIKMAYDDDSPDNYRKAA